MRSDRLFYPQVNLAFGLTVVNIEKNIQTLYGP